MAQTAAKLDTSTLSSYLADHIAGSSAGVDLAESLAKNVPGNEFFEGLVSDIKKDQDALERVMDKVGASESTVKTAGAQVAQKIGSGLSGVGGSGMTEKLGVLRESEMLSMGIMGKLCLWDALNEISDTDERLASFDFSKFGAAARSQLSGLDAERLKLARKAFLH